MDALGYAQFGGRREGLADHYAPWLYRITALELAREGKIDNNKTLRDGALPLRRYSRRRRRRLGRSVLRDARRSAAASSCARSPRDGTLIDGPQITADYAAAATHDYKRVAIPLPAGVVAADIDHFVFDAYDNDGIYVTAIGDVFIPAPHGPNGAKLDYVRRA